MKWSQTDQDGLSSVRYVALSARDSLGTFKTAVGYRGHMIGVEYEDAVMRGGIANAAPFTTNGQLTTAGATGQPVCSSGVSAINIPASSGVQMSFVSSSAQDGVAGTGIRTLIMEYLDVNLNQKTETITMNGTTPVSSVATDVRWIQNIEQITFGSGKAAAGNISATNGGLTYAYIVANRVRYECSFVMVPNGKIFVPKNVLLTSVAVTADTYSLFDITLLDTNYFCPQFTLGVQNNSKSFPITGLPALTAGNIIGITHTTNKAAYLAAAIQGTMENAV